MTPKSALPRAVLAGLCAAFLFPAAAHAEGDVFDSFFRYTETEHKAFTQELPGETVDPFSGTLRIVQVDLRLPGKAGLDLLIMRTYGSRIWGRTDPTSTTEPLLAEKEHSVLGYGWTFHMGRIRNPNASEGPNAAPDGCQVLDMPVYEAPDGTARVFYPTTPGGPVLVSRDFWRMQKNCSQAGTNGICIWSDKGVRYDFPSTGANTFFIGTTPVWGVTKITNPFNNSILIGYNGRGDQPNLITDTYGRQVSLAYKTAVQLGGDGGDNSRLVSLTENAHVYSYDHTFVPTAATGGAGRLPLPGTGRLFLSGFRPPVDTGLSYAYQYGTALAVAQNQYALTKITYPYGATMTYAYSSPSFFTGGNESVQMPAVASRAVGGSAMTSGTWTYSYSSPTSGMQTATISRPDGKQDTYSMFGFGAVANGTTWKAGLTSSVTIGGIQTTTFDWDNTIVPSISAVHYPAPNYAPSSTATCTKPYDTAVSVPVMTKKTIQQDGPNSYITTYGPSFDAYAQPLKVTEAGEQTRVTDWTYFSAAVNGSTVANMVRGFPLSQHVCIGADCFTNSWTYNGGVGHGRDSETLAGTTTNFTYDASGNLAAVKNPLNQTLTLGAYSNGVPTSFNFNGAFTTSQTPLFEGWITSQTNGRGAITGHGYDSIGRVTSETPPAVAPPSAFAYPLGTSCTLSGTPISITPAPTACVNLTRGTYSKKSFFDGLGRVVATSDNTGVFTTVKYDALGRIVFKSYPFDSTGEVGDSISVDGLGRTTALSKGFRPALGHCDDSASCTTTTSYASNCATTTVQRATSDSTTTKRCAISFGDPGEQRLVKVTDAKNQLWQYGYDAHGDLTAVTAPDPKGNESYTYFAANQFLQTEKRNESSLGSQPSFTYTRNAAGQPLTRVDAAAITTTYSYEPQLNRLNAIGYSMGGLAPRIATRGALTNTFDGVNRITQMKWVINGLTFITTPAYDSNGCMNSLTYPTGTVVTQSCDAADRVTSIQIGTTSIASNIQYHPSGQPKSITYGNATLVSSTFDDRMRLKTATASGIIGLSYTYDGADNVKSFDNSAVPGAARTMIYDPLDRLSSAIAPFLWGSGTYDYDLLGNRTFNSDNTITASYAYDANNHLHAANTGTRPVQRSFAWDAGNRLAASFPDGTTYFYDGLGRRVQKTDSSGTVLYHYGPEGRLLAETDGAGARLRDYVYLGGKLIAISGCISAAAPPCSELQWVYTDVKGSVLARADGTPAVVARLDYKPWGEQWTVPTVPGDRQYDGRVRDSGTGFSDFGARYYWPEIGRFVSPDFHQFSSQWMPGFNRYAFGFDNPGKYTDPDGHVPFLVVTGLVGAGIGAVYGAYTSMHSDGGFSWATVGKDAAIGLGIGLGAGVLGSLAVTGSAVSETGLVMASAKTLIVTGGATYKAGEAVGEEVDVPQVAWKFGQQAVRILPSAVKHINERVVKIATEGDAALRNLNYRLLQESFNKALEVAMRGSITYGQKIYVDGWEFIFQEARDGGTPVLIHALQK